MNEQEPDPRPVPAKQAEDIRAEVGAALRAARLKRGQSLEAVAQQTRIPKRYLEFLENGRFDEFPAAVYMRGFLKGYCDHLDAPFDEYWAKIQPPRAEAAPETKPKPLSASSPSPAAASHAPHAPGGSSAAGAVLFALALAVGLGVWLFKDRRPAAAARPPASTPRALLPLARTTEPKIGLRAVDDAWVRVTVDDNVAFEGRLPRGGAMEWKPARSVSLRTTAPSSLQFTVNGAPQALANPTPDGEYRIEVQ